MLITKDIPFKPKRIAILRISDTFRVEKDQDSETLKKRIEQFKHKVVQYTVSRASQQEITAQLDAWADQPDIDVVISIGGTGLTPYDTAIEAHHSIYETEFEGFSHLFYLIAYKHIGAAALSLRVSAGLTGETYFFALPDCIKMSLVIWDKLLRYQLDARYTANL